LLAIYIVSPKVLGIHQRE